MHFGGRDELLDGTWSDTTMFQTRYPQPFTFLEAMKLEVPVITQGRADCAIVPFKAAHSSRLLVRDHEIAGLTAANSGDARLPSRLPRKYYGPGR